MPTLSPPWAEGSPSPLSRPSDIGVIGTCCSCHSGISALREPYRDYIGRCNECDTDVTNDDIIPLHEPYTLVEYGDASDPDYAMDLGVCNTCGCTVHVLCSANREWLDDPYCNHCGEERELSELQQFVTLNNASRSAYRTRVVHDPPFERGDSLVEAKLPLIFSLIEKETV